MRKLVITEHHEHVWSVENSSGQRTQGSTLEQALARFAFIYALDITEIRSGHDACEQLDTLCGLKRGGDQIHTGVLSG